MKALAGLAAVVGAVFMCAVALGEPAARAGTPAAPHTAAVSTAMATHRTSAEACSARARVIYTLPRGAHVRRATVAGRRVKAIQHGRRVVVRLAGRHGRVRVKLTYRTRGGRTRSHAWSLDLCSPPRVVQPPALRLPCDIYAAAGIPCAAAYSSTRALFAKYDGRLYQVKRASDAATMDVDTLTPGGYADAGAQNAFCAHTSCVVSKLYDQTSDDNTLVPQPPTTEPYSNTVISHEPVSANALPILADGHPVYGLKFQDDSPTGLPCPTAATCLANPEQAYDNGHVQARGVAVGSQPESTYAVFGGTFSGDQCCFDFGNSEIKGTDDGNGTMDALNFSRACWDACGPDGGPWAEADLENGMFMTGETTPTAESPDAYIGGSYRAGDGFCCDATAANRAMRYPFVTALLENPGSETFALKGADANTGGLMTFYDGSDPPGAGYSPARKEGGIILGSGGDQGATDGEFFEGVMTKGVPPAAAEAAVQANIVAVHYTMR